MHTIGPVQKALLDLEGQIERLRFLASHISVTDEWIVQNEQRFRVEREAKFTIENRQMLMLFALYDSIENVIVLSRAIYKALDGSSEAIATMKIHGSSPVDEENEKMAAARVLPEDVVAWLNG